jgi:2-C-methyl-D-erythritol 4-phosphate cytidylyltransferase
VNGLLVLPVKGIVAIHDAARPLLNPAMLAAGIRACRRFRAVTFGHAVTDTLKRAKGSRINATVDRAGLVAVQTPQFFDLPLLRRAHDSARAAGIRATDDCAVVEHLGVKPAWLPGPRTNIKVTLPEDLRVCAALL